ncbi:caspase-8 [Lingula anatina]|uniref:Caspase-8 n=1 Tax=Lingula anatina TaxID=7574 RepID=A0A1S3H7N3_LINAN|nr:caspase-8 [Lingula anatina]|eukprot:XP_013381129.1 caspase-8 [Lingula anatina]
MIETDAVQPAQASYFRMLLKKVDEQLVSRDLNAIKFLCRDVLPHSKLEKINRGLALFTELEYKGLLSPNNLKLLEECLFRIQRADLLKQMGFSLRDMKNKIEQHGEQLSPFRVLLHDIAEDVSKSEVESMKFIAQAHVPRYKTENAKDLQTLFVALEQQNLLTPDDLDVLVEMVQCIDRKDLLTKIDSYKTLSRHGNVIDLKRREPVVVPPKVPMMPKRPEPVLRPNPPPPGRSQQTPQNTDNNRRQLVGQGDTASEPNIAVHDQEATEARDQFYNPKAGHADAQHVAQRLERITIRDDHMDLPSYKMDSNPRGMCFIINNEKFYKIEGDQASKKMPDRTGTDVDCGNLHYVFSKLKFTVKVYKDLTDQEITRTMVDAAYNIDHSTYDCFVCCILSHGQLGSVYGVNGRLVLIKDITNCFKANLCTSLAGKPKLFFIQACQGKDKQEGSPLEMDSAMPGRQQVEEDAPGEQETIPNEADFLMGYATIPGFVSYRSRTHGSWYITKLVEMLDRYGERYDLVSIMTRVNEEVGKANAELRDGRYKQSPAPMFTLRKRIFFT